MFCKTCGNLLDDREKVCNVCGAPVEADPVTPAQTDAGQTQYSPESPASGYAALSAKSGPISIEPAPYPSSYTSLSAEPAQLYSGQAPSVPEPAAPAYTPLSNDAAQTSLFEDASSSAATPKKFDFNWETEAFDNQVSKGMTEDIDFKWNVGIDSVDLTPEAPAAADEPAGAEMPQKPAVEYPGIFDDDTFHLRASEQDDAKLATTKKNEEFQELLDEEFENMMRRQAEIGDERIRANDPIIETQAETEIDSKRIDEELVNEIITSPSVTPPSAAVTGETARGAAEARIQEYLRKADMDMLSSLQEQPKTGVTEPAIEPGSGIFATDFANPFAPGDVTAGADAAVAGIGSMAAESAAPDFAAAGATAAPDSGASVTAAAPEKAESEIFDTGFANPFAADAFTEAKPVETTPVMTVPTAVPVATVPVSAPESTAPAPTAPYGNESIFVAESAPIFAEVPDSPMTLADIESALTPAQPEMSAPAQALFQTTEQAATPTQTGAPAYAPFPAPEPTVAQPQTGAPAYATFPAPEQAAVPTQTGAPAYAPFPAPAPAAVQPQTGAPAYPPFPAPEQEAAPPQAQVPSYPPFPAAEQAAAQPQTGAPAYPAFPATEQAAAQPQTGAPAYPPFPAPEQASEPAAPQPYAPAEPPIMSAPVTEAKYAPVSTREHAQEIINKPVIFPFDDSSEKAAAGIKAADATAEIFKVPNGKTPEAYKPALDPEPVAADPFASAVEVSVQLDNAEKSDRKSARSKDRASRKNPSKAMVIAVDILIIIAIIMAACFALVKFAPDTGAAELINKGINFFTGSSNESSAAAAEKSPNYVMPTTDGDTLVSSQKRFSYNIEENNIIYDPGASWKEDVKYSIEGAAAAKPIDDDYWKEGSGGTLRYDESAVAAVIKFDSCLVEYINTGVPDQFLNTIIPGSAAEKKLTAYVASVKQISIDKLGIGNIRKNGDDLYVWTKETVTETKGGSPVQREFMRLYLLTPDNEEYKVSDFEDLS